MYDVILKYASYLFLLVGFCLVLIPTAITFSKKEKQSKEVFLINTFVPNMVGLLFVAFGYWGTMQNISSDHLWQLLIIITAIGGIFVSSVSAYMSMVILRWRAD